MSGKGVLASLRGLGYRMLCQVGMHQWVYIDPVFPRVVRRSRVHYPRKCTTCMKEEMG